MHLNHLAGFWIFFDIYTGNQIRIPESYLTARSQAVVLRRRFFAEIFLFDIENPGKRNFACSTGRILGIIYRLELFHLIFGVVVNYQAQRMQHAHYPQRVPIQVLADTMLQ